MKMGLVPIGLGAMGSSDGAQDDEGAPASDGFEGRKAPPGFKMHGGMLVRQDANPQSINEWMEHPGSGLVRGSTNGN